MLPWQEEILELDKRISASTTKVIDKGEELVRARKVESNMAAAVDSLTMCLPVLAAYAKLQRQLKDKRYYPALKTLEQLEHHDLPKVTNYRFSTQITEQIPLYVGDDRILLIFFSQIAFFGLQNIYDKS